MEKSSVNTLEITWGSLWRVVVLLCVVSFLFFVRDILVGVILAIVISSALDPIVSFFERKRIPRILGTLGIFIVVITSLALLLYTVVPIALTELNILITHITSADTPLFGLKEASEIIKAFNESIGRLANLLISGSTSLLETVSKFLGGLMLMGSIFVLSFYLTVDRDGVENFLRAILPPGYEDIVLNVYERTRRKIGRWLQGQIFLSLSIGVSVFLGLWILGIRYSLILGILAGLLEIIPFVGPILSGATAFLIAISQSVTSGIWVLILFLVIQQVEGTLLVPVFMKLTTDLHPAMILISLLIGSKLLGFIGIILAVPAAVLAQEVINHWSTFKLKKKGMF
ncbi:MAG TPA: AI-2E family transporter [Candidatus Paceibacterota bacterium]